VDLLLMDLLLVDLLSVDLLSGDPEESVIVGLPVRTGGGDGRQGVRGRQSRESVLAAPAPTPTAVAGRRVGGHDRRQPPRRFSGA
jgi:hypothetical protein